MSALGGLAFRLFSRAMLQRFPATMAHELEQEWSAMDEEERDSWKRIIEAIAKQHPASPSEHAGRGEEERG